MPDKFPEERFPSSDDMLKRMLEKSDDFDSVDIMVTNDLPMTGPAGESVLLNDCCCIIKTCTDESIVMHRDEFQNLLNDGIFDRLKIPIKLVPQIKR